MVLKLKTSQKSQAVQTQPWCQENIYSFSDMMLTLLSHKGNPSTAFCSPSPIGLITLEELHQQVLKGRGKFAQDVSQQVLSSNLLEYRKVFKNQVEIFSPYCLQIQASLEIFFIPLYDQKKHFHFRKLKKDIKNPNHPLFLS